MSTGVQVNATRAQTFSVANTGTLAGLDVLVGYNGHPDAPIYVDIRPLTSGLIDLDGRNFTLLSEIPIIDDSQNLGRVAILPEMIPDRGLTFVHIDLTPFSIAVSAGQHLSFVMSSTVDPHTPSGGQYLTGGFGIIDAYAGGQFYQREVPDNFWNMHGIDKTYDMSFRTYVECAEINQCNPFMPPPPPPPPTAHPSQVPAPSTFTLMVSGIAVIASVKLRI